MLNRLFSSKISDEESPKNQLKEDFVLTSSIFNFVEISDDNAETIAGSSGGPTGPAIYYSPW